jgi:RNA polymerase sigma factor (sigma-70 family)
MSAKPLSGILGYLRRASADRATIPDARLLERFAAVGDPAAFELLVWRHGPMVLGVCRRLLRHEQDAEDAFQAAFLTLARRAGAVGRRGSVGGWLYRVAYRIALDARDRVARRSARERHADLAGVVGRTEPCAEAAARELGRALDDEVGRLPERYRLPFILCCLQGRSNAEAAREIGCRVKTVESRLARARGRLRARLTRRGFCVSAGLTAVLASGPEAGAGVPAGLVAATLRTATAVGRAVSANVLALTEGVLRVMFLTKVKAVTGALVVAAVVAGAGGWGYRTWAAEGTGAPAGGPAAGSHFVAVAGDPQAKGQREDAPPKRPARPQGEDVRKEVKRLYEVLEQLQDPDHLELVVQDPARRDPSREDPRELLRLLQQQLEKQQKEQKRLQELLELLSRHLASQPRADAPDPAIALRQRKALEAIEAAVAELLDATRANPALQQVVADFVPAVTRLRVRLTNAPPPSRPKVERPAGASVEGVVREVSHDGLVRISIGMDTGIRPGQELDVYRLKPEPKYLGKITVVDVRENEAVAKRKAGNAAGAILVGDRVGNIAAQGQRE